MSVFDRLNELENNIDVFVEFLNAPSTDPVYFAGQYRKSLLGIIDDMMSLAQSLSAGVTRYATVADMSDDLANKSPGAGAYVYADTADNNGFYHATESDWVRESSAVNDAISTSQKTEALVSDAGIQISSGEINGIYYPLLITDSADRAAAGVDENGVLIGFANPGLYSPTNEITETDDPDYVWAVMDDNDRVALAVRSDGSVVAHIPELAALNDIVTVMTVDNAVEPSTDTDYPFAIIDDTGRVGLAVTRSGEIIGRVRQTDQQSTPHAVQINHIVHMGQSLGAGEQSLPVVTQLSGWGNHRFQRGVHTWSETDNAATPELRAESDFLLVPLTATTRGVEGETIANGMCDHLKSSVFGGRFAARNPAEFGPSYMMSYAGQGGRYLRELNKAHDDATDARAGVRQSPGGYYATSIDDVRRAAAQASEMGVSYAVAAVTWMQGEANNTYALNRWDDPLSRDEFLAAYAADLIQLKDDYNADVRAITGQFGRVPFLTYQSVGTASGSAQMRAADLDDEIFLASPIYMLPSAVNARYGGPEVHGAAIHITADAERWLGEQFGKVLGRINSGENWQPLRPLSARFSNAQTVLVSFHVPSPPLVIDTDFLPAQESGRGFQVLNDVGNAVGISSIELLDGYTVRINLSESVASGSVRYGLRGNAFTVSQTILSVAAGDAFDNGAASTDITFSGDISDEFSVIQSEGAFMLKNTESAPEYAQIVVRNVSVNGDGNTVLSCETRDLAGASFVPGQTCIAARFYGYGNLRDSDNTMSIYEFGDVSYGQRRGHYPLWNWCVAFENLTIE